MNEEELQYLEEIRRLRLQEEARVQPLVELTGDRIDQLFEEGMRRQQMRVVHRRRTWLSAAACVGMLLAVGGTYLWQANRPQPMMLAVECNSGTPCDEQTIQYLINESLKGDYA